MTMTTEYEDTRSFADSHARPTDPDPSREAAEAVDLSARRILMDDLYGRLLLVPSTDHELKDWYFRTHPGSTLDPESIRRRRSDLQNEKKVIPTKLRRPSHIKPNISITVWGAALPPFDGDAA